MTPDKKGRLGINFDIALKFSGKQYQPMSVESSNIVDERLHFSE
jgi:hypothetical protein